MDGKMSLLLVLGKSQSLRAFDLMEPLAESYDVRSALFLNAVKKPFYTSKVALQGFLEDQHLPGTMLGLEPELAKADIIIACGFADASTMQALRFAVQHKKPFFVFSSDPMDLKWGLEHEPQVVQDVLDNASGFLVYGEEAQESLAFIGISEEKILCLAPRIFTRRMDFSEALSRKFRQYLGLQQDAWLLVNSDPLFEEEACRQLIFALKHLKQNEPDLIQNWKILLTGSGEAKEKLKYLAVDLGLAQHFLFIGQDISPFQRDLYSAANLAVSLIDRRDEKSAYASFWVLEAMACGARPLVNEQHPLAPSLRPMFTVDIASFASLAQELKQAFEQKSEAAYQKQAVLNLCRYQFDAEDSKELVETFLWRLAQKNPDRPFQLCSVEFEMDCLSLQKELQSESERASPLLEELLLKWEWHPEYRANIQLMKGHFALRLGDLDGAMSAFEICTAVESVQREAYLGLGKIAYMSFASEEAQSFYRKALAIRPNDPEAMAGLGMVYRKASMPDDAVYWLGRSLSVDIDNFSTLIALTQACLECQHLDRAIDVLEQLKVIVGEKPPVVMALGQMYYKVGECEKGRELVDQALMHSTGDAVKVLKIKAA